MKEMFELTPLDIKADMSSDELDELLKPLVEGELERVFFSTIHQRKDKTTYPVDVYIQAIKYEEIDAYIAIVIDITEKKKIENELLDKEEIMLAQSRHAAMGEMISMIAHQWRQPISVIAMDANNILADIELEMVEEESLQTGAEDIIKQTQELSKTIDDFRNFFRPEKIPEEVFLDDIISDALGVIGKSLQHNNVEVILDTDKEIKLKTYSRELMQVLINLIKNAKEVLLENSVNDGKISISTKDDGKSILVTICDNGGGVKDEIQDKIFEPYFTTKGEKNGTGLGLYMSKTIIEKHFLGRLSVYNEKEGACFEINLPLNIKDSGALDG
ncbi:MAG: PAS domain-containing sensor histidine kinase [Sulfurimonas sp.]|nr:PAS domain-containing sensor histidine kinase [Sulfurimonas sp.]